jgi:hypothetical protein
LTTDQIFILRQIYQKTWEFDREIHVLFIDFKKANDSIHRKSLINILRELHFKNKFIKLIEISILETFVKVRIGNITTDPILVKSGLRQGDAMSSILFNIVVEKVIMEMNITQQEGVKFQELPIGLLA